MAKLTAPLFSFGASGAIGKSLVFFPWKGINAVRQFVIPANPKTTAQATQRGYLKDAVDAVHYAQIVPANPLNAKDIAALELLGTTFPTPRTWFNVLCRMWMKMKVQGKTPVVLHGATVTPGSGTLTLVLYSDDIVAGGIETGLAFYGTSKSALLHYLEATPDLANNKMTCSLVGLANGTKYFVQFKAASVEAYVGNDGLWSGIYTDTPHA